jgi:hypothetical protein
VSIAQKLKNKANYIFQRYLKKKVRRTDGQTANIGRDFPITFELKSEKLNLRTREKFAGEIAKISAANS